MCFHFLKKLNKKKILNGSSKKSQAKAISLQSQPKQSTPTATWSYQGSPTRQHKCTHFLLPLQQITEMLLQLLDKYSYIWRKDEWKQRNNFSCCCSSTWRHFKATLKPQLAEKELCQSPYPSCGKRRDWKAVCCWEVCFIWKEQQLAYIISSWQFEVHLREQSSANTLMWPAGNLCRGMIPSPVWE